MIDNHKIRCIECRKRPVEVAGRCCGATCRKRRGRRQMRAQLTMRLMMTELDKIRDSIKRGEQISKFVSDLKRVQDEIKDLLHLARDPDEVARRDMIEDRARRTL